MQSYTQQSSSQNYDGHEAQTTFDWSNPLLTDLYQITMSYAEWKSKRSEEPCVFEAFFRKSPFKGNYTVFAGLDEVLRFLKDFKFTESHLVFLKKRLPYIEDEFFTWLGGLDCKQIKVYGCEDATITYPSEPLLRLEGPFSLLQLLETPILNLLNFSSLICTNASRMHLVAGDKVKCVEFGLRRAQGPNGALTASKYAYVGGFEATSNVYAGYLYDIPIAGTQAHSFIMSFEDEKDCEESRWLAPAEGGEKVDLLAKALEYRTSLGWDSAEKRELYAFVSFATAYPSAFSALVDSYSTKNSGVKNFLLVSLALEDLGYSPVSIRLDSGDLADLAAYAKNLFKSTGEQYGRDFSHIRVVASNDINEHKIHELNAKNHQIDFLGIGTNLVTCQSQPALGMVYKVCEFKGTPRIKISEEPGKSTIPGAKSVLRALDENGAPKFDILCLASEYESFKKLTGSTAIHDQKTKIRLQAEFSTLQGLTIPLFENGDVCERGRHYDVKGKRAHLLGELNKFGGRLELIEGTQTYKVYLSEQCFQLQQKMLKELQQKN